MKHQIEITPYDIDRIVEFALEDIQQSQFSIDDIEENIGLYLENIPGMEVVNDSYNQTLIITISEIPTIVRMILIPLILEPNLLSFI